MQNQELLVVAIGICLLMIISVFVVSTSVKRSGNKKDAEEFLLGLSSRIRLVILEVIKTFDPSIIKDLSEDTIAKIETAILSRIYDVCWGYIEDKVKEELNKDPNFVTQAVLSLLQNREFVEQFIRDIIQNSESLQSVINSKAEEIAKYIIDKRLEDSEKEDKELQEEFSDQEKYFEEATDEDLSSGEVVEEPTEEELSKLNPQVDEPEELDPENDSSVEVIDDDIYYDKSGRPRSKKTGKWTKVDK